MLKIFFWYQQSSDIKQELIKQLNALKLFNMEPHKTIRRRNILYQKKKITVRKKSIENHKIQLVILTGVNKEVNVNQ